MFLKVAVTMMLVCLLDGNGASDIGATCTNALQLPVNKDTGKVDVAMLTADEVMKIFLGSKESECAQLALDLLKFNQWHKMFIADVVADTLDTLQMQEGPKDQSHTQFLIDRIQMLLKRRFYWLQFSVAGFFNTIANNVTSIVNEDKCTARIELDHFVVIVYFNAPSDNQTLLNFISCVYERINNEGVNKREKQIVPFNDHCDEYTAIQMRDGCCKGNGWTTACPNGKPAAAVTLATKYSHSLFANWEEFTVPIRHHNGLFGEAHSQLCSKKNANGEHYSYWLFAPYCTF